MDLLVDSSQLIQLRKVTTTDLIIGEGAYGRVIKLRVHGTVCAAREILVDRVTPETTRKSFFTEFVNASRIHHPNIVQVLGIHYPTPETELPWLVMEMMECSLKDFLDKAGKDGVPFHLQLSILVDVSQGLEFLHGQDIVHGNLTSNNVLLTKHCVAKIADLGVAKAKEQCGLKTHTPSALHFLSPEALLSVPEFSKPVDVFSLGCIACHVISNEWPEPKDCVSESILTEMSKREQYLQSCTHSSLRKLIELCLEDLPEQRPLISTVYRELSDLKTSVDSQIPFATASYLELFSAIQLEKAENVKSTDALAKMEATVMKKDVLLQELQKSIKSSHEEASKQGTSQGETSSYSEQNQRIVSDYFNQLFQRRPPRFQADTITLRSTDGVMTESAPSTSYGYHRPHPRDQPEGDGTDPVQHKVALTPFKPYKTTADPTSSVPSTTSSTVTNDVGTEHDNKPQEGKECV